MKPIDFLLTGLLYPALLLAKPQENTEETCEKTKVAVLGAGVAGITAAQALTEHSVTDFLIVEYQGNVGGRMHKVEFGKKDDGSPYVVEAGANWVQGLRSEEGPENPIYTLAKKYNLRTLVSDLDNVTTYDHTGASDYINVLDAGSDALADVLVDAGDTLMNNLQDKSFRAALRHAAGWKPKKTDAHSQLAEWWSFDSEFCFTPEESSSVFTSVAENATFQYFSEDSLFVVDQRGFAEASTFLTYNDTRLRLNTIVTGVDYSDNGTTIHTDTGCIEAEYAIVTFSLGVLQNDMVKFQPELPEWKQSAIASFEIGTYTKIFMQFDEPFWEENTQFILWADPYERGYYPQFQPLDLPQSLPGSGILVATIVNKQSYKAEAQSNAQTQWEIMEVLRQIYGQDIGDPTEIYYPRWTQEPWAFGSYSNWPPSTSLAAHQNLRTNLGRLFFAGEATSQEFFGYLHGAWFEGDFVGDLIASCIQGDINCTDDSGQSRYPVLKGVTPYDMYNEENGWLVDPLSR